ncbi:hypothetical protein HK105_206264 [Polyrhizophydium stewartii]|uniref:Uncharacterized protein n=1 Tax=Polyrhizophydium stewartii TaxID=2732419 RepID=A0ABR4N3V5_9FUNG
MSSGKTFIFPSKATAEPAAAAAAGGSGSTRPTVSTTPVAARSRAASTDLEGAVLSPTRTRTLSQYSQHADALAAESWSF